MSVYKYIDAAGAEASGDYWAEGPAGVPGHSYCRWVLNSGSGRIVLIGKRRKDQKVAEVVSLKPGESIEIEDGNVVVIAAQGGRHARS